MGYGTQHPHSQKENTELYNILKFGVNQANIRQDTAIQKLQIFYLVEKTYRRTDWPTPNFTKKCMERRTCVRRSIHFLVNFLSF